jgi:hypothetical protein
MRRGRKRKHSNQVSIEAMLDLLDLLLLRRRLPLDDRTLAFRRFAPTLEAILDFRASNIAASLEQGVRVAHYDCAASVA